MANPTKLFWPRRSWRDYGEIVFVDSREEPLGPPTPTPPSILKLQCDDAEWWLTAVAQLRADEGRGALHPFELSTPYLFQPRTNRDSF